jgi:hypothetical protein
MLATPRGSRATRGAIKVDSRYFWKSRDFYSSRNNEPRNVDNSEPARQDELARLESFFHSRLILFEIVLSLSLLA